MSHNNPSVRFWLEDLNHKLDRVLGIELEDPPLPEAYRRKIAEARASAAKREAEQAERRKKRGAGLVAPAPMRAPPGGRVAAFGELDSAAGPLPITRSGPPAPPRETERGGRVVSPKALRRGGGLVNY